MAELQAAKNRFFFNFENLRLADDQIHFNMIRIYS